MNVLINKNDKILVVAPHADDESIGCGGLLSLYGNQADLLLITDGSKGYTTHTYSNENDLVQIRSIEFNNAAKLANVKSVFCCNIVDGTVKKSKNKIYQFDIKNYNYIFVPNRYESHPDHNVLSAYFKSMKRKQKSKAKIFEYEVWTPLRHPTWYLDITSVADKKREMIKQHKSQLKDIDYLTKGMALSCYRGIFIVSEYAEAFMDARYNEFLGKLYSLLPAKCKSTIKSFLMCKNNSQ